jgi:hypothetical protein
MQIGRGGERARGRRRKYGGTIMGQTRFEKGLMLFCMLFVLLVLAGTDTEAQTQPSAGKAKVDRLVMGLITPYLDYVRPWINGTSDHNIVHDPAFE